MTATYDQLLVLVSYAISVFGSYTGLQLVGQISTGKKEEGDMLWLTAAAVALGGGAIWSMHFIAMLAYKLPIPVIYDVKLTLLSMVVAIVVTLISLSMVIRSSEMKIGKLAAAGTIMGLGVAAMHYTGMMAMKLDATMSYNQGIIVLSVAIAIIAATAALWIAFSIRGPWQKLASAFVMGMAVCGMHYTAMLGVTFAQTTNSSRIIESVIFGNELASYIGAATFAVLVLGLAVSLAKGLRQTRDA